MIKKYFKKIEKFLERFTHIIEDYIIHKEILSDNKGIIDGEVFFNNESRLDFMEAVDMNKNEKNKYSYHYMNNNNEMVFRYDNAKHHRELSTFPHHKHTKNGIISSNEAKLDEVLSEIEKEVLKKK
ncbi:MAG: hypothetical protein B6I24_00905 [Bacteroidetes bacterium 4572_128]|nr:MAG: hypothetical protein B6I24_00905 [Bacteroidetes bacterium 4572_128]